MKNKNPLFVVTNKGNTVEEAKGILDALIKKLGLDGVLNFFEIIFETIKSSVSPYVSLTVMNELLERLVGELTNFVAQAEEFMGPYRSMAEARVEQALRVFKDFQRMAGVKS